MAEPGMIPLHPDAFDNFASDYDAEFAHRAPGRWLREAVWRLLAPYVRPGTRAVDLGCGTGEDAVWLARAGCEVTAVDSSPAMLQATLRKATQCGVSDQVAVRPFDLNAPDDIGGSFDFVLSNFGALNCATDLKRLGTMLHSAVAPGGIVAAVMMGRFCAWETLWYGMRLKPAAVRRWRGRAAADIGGKIVPVQYWSARDLAESLGTAFRTLSIHPVGLFLPPSDLFALIERRPRLFAHLTWWEARVSSYAPLAHMADHHLTILQRAQEDARP
ncbi:MAG: hypothetical protein JWM91_1098 [Rhodospirillales bacterium]|nr:hypothetical protein [Rhodospirillales bacterium]